MRKNSSYLDSINEGRQRRARTSLDDLDRTLRGLEEKISHATAAKTHGGSAHEFADRFRNLAGDSHRAPPPPPPPRADRLPPASSFKSLAQDIELARLQEKNVAAVESIAAELQSLRDELQNKMASGLHREFDALRADIAETYRATQSGVSANDLSEDIARLTDGVRSLAQRSEDSGVQMLRVELDEVKRALGALAREDTIQQMNQRWDDLDRKWQTDRRGTDLASEPEFQHLTARLDDISTAINSLPNSLSLDSLEDKLRILANAVEHLSQNSNPVSPQTFELIEGRLDEISRAIVASSVSVQAAVPNNEPFERVEARISALARQIDELTEAQSSVDSQVSSDLLDRMSALTERVEHLAQNVGPAPDAVESLAAQIAELSEKIDGGIGGAQSDVSLSELESRYDRLVEMIERQQDANEEQGRALLRDLESRLDRVAGKADQDGEFGQESHEAVIQAIDARFNEMARYFDTTIAREPDQATVRNIELRLEEITNRLERAEPTASGVNPELISNLETQIAGLTDFLNKPGSPMPEQQDLSPRLQDIEKSIAGTREQIAEAAREAAEQAIRSLPANAGDNQSVTALAQDLKSLEQLARSSDERNTRTFEAIHGTLLTIVDRLGSLESGAAGAQSRTAAPPPVDSPIKAPADPPMFDEANTPSLQPQEPASDFGHSDDEVDKWVSARLGQKVSPADAAAMAASAAAAEGFDERPEQTMSPAKKSMLDGLTRALKGRNSQPQENAPDPDTEPAGEPEMPDAALAIDPSADANTPLEPGSGAPDLESIVARVQHEKTGQSGASVMDAAKSDFIAAARRAAQAAAAEAETTRNQLETRRNGGRFGALTALQNKRKPILIGASVLLIALAGVQLGGALFDRSSGPANVAEAPIVEDQVVPADAAPEAEQAEIADDVTIDPPSVRVVEAEEATDSAMADRVVADPASAAGRPAAEMAVDTSPAPEAETEVKVTPAPTAIVGKVPVEAGPVALREAAESGDARALYEVASRFAEGRGVKSDLKQAARWYQMAADLGFAPAQYRIGNMHEKGIGLERDTDKAMTWYQMAAEQGNASAMHNLAVLFAMGANGQPDNESAARWFQKAAELGVKDSQFNLGILSAKGVGMLQDLEASYKWFALAAQNGDKDAASKRDEIANALRPEQLANGRAAVELWRAKPVDQEANTVVIPAEWKEDKGQTAGVDLKQAVRNIQLILNKEGYDAGPADGVMGVRTKNAIAAFQKDNGMAATGEVDEALVKALLEKNQ